jgi:hypothetical protein
MIKRFAARRPDLRGDLPQAAVFPRGGELDLDGPRARAPGRGLPAAGRCTGQRMPSYFALGTTGIGRHSGGARRGWYTRVRMRSVHVSGSSGDHVNSTTYGAWKYLYFSKPARDRAGSVAAVPPSAAAHPCPVSGRRPTHPMFQAASPLTGLGRRRPSLCAISVPPMRDCRIRRTFVSGRV